MKGLPIVERELRVRARQGPTFSMRVVAGGLSVLLTLQILLLWDAGSAARLAQNGRYAFDALASLGFLLACGSCLLTVDCLSSEQRQGTLGLLLLTRVGALEVLLGKLAAHGLAAVLGLLSIAPAMMLPLLAGGVTWGRAAHTFLALLSIVVFSLCLGLWTSSGTESMGRSARRCVLVLLILIVLPSVGAYLSAASGRPALGVFFNAINPASAFTAARAGLGGAEFSRLSIGPIYGVCFLLLAAVRFQGLERSERPGPEAAVAARLHGSRSPVGEHHPLRWVLRRDRLQSGLLWVAVAVSGALVLFAWIVPRFGLVSGMFGLQFVGGLAVASLYAYAGARFPAFAKSQGGAPLELLKTTPVGGAELLNQQWVVLRERLVGPITVTVLLVFVERFGYLGVYRGFEAEELFVGVLYFLLGAVGVILNAVGLSVLGLYLGWRFRRTVSGVACAVGLVFGLDLVVKFGFRVLFMNVLRVSTFPLGLFLMLGMPALTCAKQLWLIRWAFRRLGGMDPDASSNPLHPRKLLRSVATGLQKARHWTPSDGGPS